VACRDLEHRLALEVLTTDGIPTCEGISIQVLNSNNAYLVDAGSEAALGGIYTIGFITHYHKDHTRFMADISCNLYLGPELTRHSRIPKVERRYSPFELLLLNGAVLQTFPYSQDISKVYSNEDIEVYALPVDHIRTLKSVGYAIKNRKTGAYVWVSGDFFRLKQPSIEFLREIKPDMAVIEVTFPSGFRRHYHQNLDSVMELIEDLELKRCWFVHLSKKWDGQIKKIAQYLPRSGAQFYF